jgi:formylglycine-generating enzyme
MNKNSRAAGERVLVTIGISRYAELSPLQGPSADVTAFREVMEQQYGFHTMVDLRDDEAYGERILEVLESCGKLDEEDTLVLYYAGHGRSQKYYGMNYWLPYDAKERDIRSWIPSSMVSGAMENIPARHILLLNDSCFSGDLLDTRRDLQERKPGYEETAKRYRAREVMTSGMSEPVADVSMGGHSPFAYHLLDGLWSNDEPWIDARGLYEYVKRGVTGQTPLYGTLRGHQEGGACILYRQSRKPVQMKNPIPGSEGGSDKPETVGSGKTTTERAEPAVRVYKCPICGLRNQDEDMFECRVCGRDYLCWEHFDKEFRCCEECAETRRMVESKKKAETKQKSEAKRKAEAKRKNDQDQWDKEKWGDGHREAVREKLETGLMPMSYVEGGSFQMGSDDTDDYSDEKPVHTVQVNSFYIGTYEVTQDIYRAVMGKNPSCFYPELDFGKKPVEQVSWYDSVVFCNRLSIREGLEPVYELEGISDPNRWGLVPVYDSLRWNNLLVNWDVTGYRLPTEAEWEYAARGGAISRGYTYAGSNDPKEVAWYDDNEGEETRPVGGKRSNELGLFDMSGNVYEWCWDWYGEDYYSKSPRTNPRGPFSGWVRVLRGGSWCFAETSIRVSHRRCSTPSFRYGINGIRVLVPVPDVGEREGDA